MRHGSPSMSTEQDSQNPHVAASYGSLPALLPHLQPALATHTRVRCIFLTQSMMLHTSLVGAGSCELTTRPASLSARACGRAAKVRRKAARQRPGQARPGAAQ